MKTTTRIAKPLYFYQRWEAATGQKRDYFASRLLDMGIDVDRGDVVLNANDNNAAIARTIADVAIVLINLNWRTGKVVI